MKVKIVADGSTRGTFVTDMDGNPVDGVSEIVFQHQGGGAPELKLGIVLIPAVIEGVARVYGPNGKMISKIIYEGGSEVIY